MTGEVVELSITPIAGYTGVYKVEVRGSGFTPKNVFWRLRGEDPDFDDIIKAPSGSGLVGPDGTFFFTDTAIGVNLNEDFGGEDEIYADVNYFSGPHHKSNTIKRNF
jgi:hypothetical protein